MKRIFATAAAIESANRQMAALVRFHLEPRETDLENDLRSVWEPLANALLENATAHPLNNDIAAFEKEFPAMQTIAPEDFIGLTADTNKLVTWGRDMGGDYSEFLIHD